jgi:hypothetical protein
MLEKKENSRQTKEGETMTLILLTALSTLMKVWYENLILTNHPILKRG